MKPVGPGAGFGEWRTHRGHRDHVATKLAGRVKDILVNEGDFVEAGQPLAEMQVESLDAQRDEARAQSRQAVNAVASAEAQVVARRSEVAASVAVVGQRTSELDAVNRRLARTEILTREGALSVQELDDDRARGRARRGGIGGRHRPGGGRARGGQGRRGPGDRSRSAGVVASEATVARVEADLVHGQLRSPRSGRVQYRVAQPGEALAGGGTVLNLVDLGDVYMTFFLPETAVGRAALGGEVRIVLDAARQYVIPC